MLHRVDVKELAFGLFLIALALVAFALHRHAQRRHRGRHGAGVRAARPGVDHPGLRRGVLRHQPAQGAPEPLPELAWRPLIAILASIALFAVLFSTLGLIAACMGSVLVAGTATGPVRWGRLLLFGPVLAALLGAAVRERPGPAVQALAVVLGAVVAAILALVRRPRGAVRQPGARSRHGGELAEPAVLLRRRDDRHAGRRAARHLAADHGGDAAALHVRPAAGLGA